LASESYSPEFAFEKILRVIEHMAGVVAPPHFTSTTRIS
jgi:hypothetical protein